MRWLMALGMFAMAFLAGAGMFLATRPAPMLHALVLQLQGPGLMERCRQAGACACPDIGRAAGRRCADTGDRRVADRRERALAARRA